MDRKWSIVNIFHGSTSWSVHRANLELVSVNVWSMDRFEAKLMPQLIVVSYYGFDVRSL
jgi:hypothetical protein